jgi:hypothetical protein
MLAWQCGVKPDKLLAVDFRKKLPGRKANRYGIEVLGLQDDQVVTSIRPVDELYGNNWGMGFFKYKACDYCDDVVAEVADVAVGDAWLPQYVRDSQGTNVIIVRHPIIHHIIEQAVAEGRLKLDVLDAGEVAQSQAAGFRHRRDGLAYRLYLTDQQGEWRPPKRVQPNRRGLTHNLNKIQSLRILLSAESHSAFKDALVADDFSVFVQKMDPLVRQYQQLYRQLPLYRKFIGIIRRFAARLGGATIQTANRFLAFSSLRRS